MKTPKAKPYLSHGQVERLAATSRYPDVVRFLAYTGLRWGEATGLRVRHVDVSRRRVLVEDNAVIVNGHLQVGTPKTHERRSVPYPAFLDGAIVSATQRRRPDALLWEAEHGGCLSSGNTVNGCR